MVDGNKLNSVLEFTYIESTISSNGCIEIKYRASRMAKAKKTSSYLEQYPVLRTVQSALHFTSLTDLFTQTPSRLLWEASSHMLQLIREGCAYTYPWTWTK